MFECASDSPGDMAKPYIAGPYQRERVSLKWNLRICISDKFTGSTDNAGTVITL